MRRTLYLLIATSLFAGFLGGCLGQVGGGEGEGDLGATAEGLTAAERRTRAGMIRDAAAARGLEEGWLLAGIADAETTMSHCWSELTWACQGPASADCGGGPVVAGAGDGPCSLRQGGLGMFQFDAGDYDQTLAREGTRILSISGNTDAAVDFVIDMVIRSEFVAGVSTEAEALAWMNQVRVDDASLDAWAQTVTRYYNGCRQTSSCWAERYPRYRNYAMNVHAEMGASFWDVGAGPEPDPDPVDPGPDGGVAPSHGARFVYQSFPAPDAPLFLLPGQERDGYIEFENTGTETWNPGFTFLGTVSPRDADSPLAAASWVAPHRAATVADAVPPGEVGRFEFALRAPDALGDYTQAFNVLEEGVGWFGDVGESPADGDIVVGLRVVDDAASVTPPDPSVDPGTDPDPEAPYAGVRGDGRLSSGCAVATTPDGEPFAFFALLALVSAFRLTRRRRGR